ncbi:hypothetical protein Sme01_03250 [Sphaerisporangium melleum]|uniref:Uncharacterized protein n=1 Tax=Sphaerisporangium melleum TaxID=321316 RepID=A0A917QP84_9ACTN|nr:hypothetical protein [Sphaerisporangium melleum]GGK61506.1 hypothetical protein GCM10007964_00790 [Sphaerisporangium melleum]GII67849.1 hypothetical protein Sme01_03250 [Sphaerisporangium melleum]
MSFVPRYNPDHYLDGDGEDEPPFEDGMDVPFFTGFTLGRMWQRLKTGSPVRAVVHTYGTEMVIRMAEAKGLPFSAEYLSDSFSLVTIGALPTE